MSKSDGEQMPAATLVKTEDRRITRTKQALRHALIELMEERGLENFTVNDLCERADINRGTFYNHFHDKEGLLGALEDEFFSELECFQGRLGDMSMASIAKASLLKKPLPLLVEFFDYLRGQSDFLHAVIDAGGDASFSPRMRDSICTNLVRCMLHERYRDSTDPFVGYYVAFFASAYMGVISRWVETGMQESSEEMAVIAIRLLFIKPGESIKL